MRLKRPGLASIQTASIEAGLAPAVPRVAPAKWLAARAEV